MFELIDNYAPDFLYSDGALPFCDTWLENDPYTLDDRYKEGLEVVARLYTTDTLKKPSADTSPP